jgi:hypothetical protein
VAQHKTSSKSGGPSRTSTKSTKKVTSRRAKAGATKRDAGPPTAAEEDAVSIDRRRTERRDDELEANATVAEGCPLERRKKVNRRRQIDPTTCERDYTDQEVEFMNALDDYKRKSGRMFPTCSEVLEVLRGLGYVKLSANELGAFTPDASTASAKPMPSDWPATAAAAEEDADMAALACESQLT